MKTELTTDERVLLNKVIPTIAFADYNRLQDTLRDLIKERNAAAPPDMVLAEMEMKALQRDQIAHINAFLLEEAFYGEREGGVFFITEKGRHLRQQGALDKYYAWKEERGIGLKKELYEIKTKGYLEQDKIERHHKNEAYEKIKKFILYPLMIIILLMLFVGVVHHNHWDKGFPAMKNFLDKHQPAPHSGDKAKSDDDDKDSKDDK